MAEKDPQEELTPDIDDVSDEETDDLPAEDLALAQEAHTEAQAFSLPPNQQPGEAALQDEGEDEEQEPEIKELRQKAVERDEYYNKWLRAHADYANLQQRSRREIAESTMHGVRRVVEDFLPVLDDFERALLVADASHDFEQLMDGLRLAQQGINSALGKHGVEPIVAKGRKFDPSLHEAVAAQPDPNAAAGIVIEEIRRGYRIADRVIRPSQVVVARNQQPQENDSEKSED